MADLCFQKLFRFYHWSPRTSPRTSIEVWKCFIKIIYLSRNVETLFSDLIFTENLLWAIWCPLALKSNKPIRKLRHSFEKFQISTSASTHFREILVDLSYRKNCKVIVRMISEKELLENYSEKQIQVVEYINVFILYLVKKAPIFTMLVLEH